MVVDDVLRDEEEDAEDTTSTLEDMEAFLCGHFNGEERLKRMLILVVILGRYAKAIMGTGAISFRFVLFRLCILMRMLRSGICNV